MSEMPEQKPNVGDETDAGEAYVAPLYLRGLRAGFPPEEIADILDGGQQEELLFLED
ncbi:hypothetical protein ACRYCC_16515 [Actinomadura scrupuli]|uniref:hypothetical protein n=1 Tax=Actinomadura scrupuli TaxID=559629 RepID=UPI003D97B7C3